MSDGAVRTVIDTYLQRYRLLHGDHSDGLISIFRNYGSDSGASLLHPHSQLVATHFVTETIRAIEHRALNYYDDCGRCLICDIVAFEQEDELRLVAQNASFVCFVPVAAEVPCEMHIVPKRHMADFSEISENERTDLASILRGCLVRLSRNCGDPNYNYMIQTFSLAPPETLHLHWYVRIRPRVVNRGGFEIGTGAAINPSLPEDDARVLRGS